MSLPKRKKVPMEFVDCSECGKDVPAPISEDSKEDQIEVRCPHCKSYLTLDRVCYWSASESDLS